MPNIALVSLGILFSASMSGISFGQRSPATVPSESTAALTQKFSDLCKLSAGDGILYSEIHLPKGLQVGQNVQLGNLYVERNARGVHFQLDPRELADGSTIIDYIQVSSNPTFDAIVIARNITKSNGDQFDILFRQRLATDLSAATSEDFSLLRATTIKAMNGLPVKNQDPPLLKSEDFEQFIADHPQEIETYLQPILNSFHYERIRFVEWQLVQVFPDAFKQDAQVIRAVQDLVEKLDADSPDDRQAAFAKLKEMGPIAASIIAQLDSRNFSPEQSARIATLCQDRLTDQEVADLKADKDFLIDCLDDSRRPVRAAALDALQQAIGHHVDFDLNLNEPVRGHAVDLLRQQLTHTK